MSYLTLSQLRIFLRKEIESIQKTSLIYGINYQSILFFKSVLVLIISTMRATTTIMTKLVKFSRKKSK